MILKELLRGVRILYTEVELTKEIKGIASDSRNVEQGYAFVAIKGNKRDGNDYIIQALNKGACVIITDEEKYKKETNTVIVSNARAALSILWSNYYKNPSDGMKIVAITGTNGKTSTATYIYNILKEAEIKRGLISTTQCLINDKRIEIPEGTEVADMHSAMTTPDPKILHYLFKRMREENVEIVVMEASSHALSQNRLEGVDIEIGIFTNFSEEHLDYHGSMDEYFSAKELLIKKAKMCIINDDDTKGRLLLKKYREKSYGVSATDTKDFTISNIKNAENGLNYDAGWNDERASIKLHQIGNFNAYNSMMAYACARLLDIDISYIKKGLYKTEKIAGRLEQYKERKIFIDYAHTPRAMECVIRTVREIIPQNRLIVLFGCGGERDKSKRSKMAEISSMLADFTIITSDNPRGENPIEIIKEIVKGVANEFAVISNRREAIRYAAWIMKEGDILLLLGKGHEEYEITKEGKRYFSERKILDEIYGAE